MFRFWQFPLRVVEQPIRHSTDPESGNIVSFDDRFHLFKLCFSVYLLGMNERSNGSYRSALEVWEARQSADGTLVSVLAIATVFPVGRFLFAPGAASAWVMGIFLLAVCMACARLLNSAAMVVRCRAASPARVATQSAADEVVLDVYERAGGLDYQTGRSTSAFWLPTPGWHYGAPTGSQQSFTQSVRITGGGLGSGSGRHQN